MVLWLRGLWVLASVHDYQIYTKHQIGYTPGMTNLLLALMAVVVLQPAPAEKPRETGEPGKAEPKSTEKAAEKKLEKPVEAGISAGAIAEYVDLSTKAEFATGFKFAEGPLWLGDRLMVCDLGGDAMYTVQAGKEKEVYRQPSENAAGAARDMKGRILATHFRGKLTRQEKGKDVEVLAEGCGEVKFNKLNDLAIRSDGLVYFTDFGGDASPSKGLFMYREGKDGKGVVTQLDKELEAANGVCISPSENVLYVAEYGKNVIRSYTIAADGTLSASRVFADLSKYKGRGRTDGLKCDPVGNVWTTGPGGVFILGGTGEVLGHLDVPGPSNLAFGGADGHTLFVTAGSKVYSYKVLPRDGGEESGR